MRRFMTYALGLGLCSGAAASASAEDRALLIGVGNFANPQINALPGIDKDVNLMKQAAREMGFKDSQMKVLMDREATLANIKATFKTWLIDGAGPNDKALFYISSHGTQEADQAPLDEADGTDEVIVAYDTKVGQGRLDNALVDDELGALLDQLRTKNAFVLVDACHSGTATRDMSPGSVPKFWQWEGMPVGDGALEGDEKDAGKAAGDENHVLLTAANEKQVAQATPNGSVFTVGVLEAVRQARASNTPLTAVEIRDKAEAFIKQYFASNPRKIHTPTLYGNKSLAASNVFGAAAPGTGTTPPTTTPGAPGTGGPVGLPGTGGTPPAAGTTPPAAAGDLYAQLDALTTKAAYPVKVSARQQTYAPGQNLVVDVDVAQAGYVNVLNVGQGDGEVTVLYPNQYHRDNKVAPGRLTIPTGTEFDLPAGLPPGQTQQQTIIVVVHTSKPLSAYDAGSGTGFLRSLGAEATRAFSVAAGAGAPNAAVRSG